MTCAEPPRSRLRVRFGRSGRNSLGRSERTSAAKAECRSCSASRRRGAGGRVAAPRARPHAHVTMDDWSASELRVIREVAMAYEAGITPKDAWLPTYERLRERGVLVRNARLWRAELRHRPDVQGQGCADDPPSRGGATSERELSAPNGCMTAYCSCVDCAAPRDGSPRGRVISAPRSRARRPRDQMRGTPTPSNR